ncbi:MAG: lamin tail domain-containing protein [Myxococcaceae bacterium]|nr:lamin tail domain-containing protein [Myxococcaceae bacterium]
MRSLVLVCLAAAPAFAGTITVDGNPADWSARLPSHDNQGLVVRTDGGTGEFVFSDRAGDQRTDLGSPSSEVDIRQLRITGDATNLYVLLRTASATGPLVPQLQLSVDLDRTAGSGQEFLANFADTRVTTEARWEFLVFTQRPNNGPGQVIDTSFNSVTTTVVTARSGDTLELSVPWSAFGLMGPPAAPIRFTAALFAATSADLTADINGPSSSNAIDAVGNCADPGSTANAFACDLSDDDVDWYADVWFQPSGDVYAPLLITRFVPNASGTEPELEWLTLTNVSPVAIDLAGYKVGDEETPDQGEAMRLLPSLSVAAGASVAIAVSATAYEARYGEPPGIELTSTSAAVPDAPAYAPWATGGLNLNNAGDDLLLLDRSDIALDVVSFGNASWGGVTAIAGTFADDAVLARELLPRDTDDGLADFTNRGVACAVPSACTGGGVCNACTFNTCYAQAGVSCSDGNACNGAETCSAAGACQAGTPLVCNDLNPCTADSCDVVSGCQVANEMPGTLCSDGDACNGVEVCDALAACQPGTPLVCADTNPCTADSCSATTGCVNVPGNAGALCRSAVGPCDAPEVCDGASATCPADVRLTTVCRPADGGCDVAELCDGVSAQCPPNAIADAGAVCRAASGTCDIAELCNGASTVCPANVFVADDTACNDTLTCNGPERCVAGACTPGMAPSCNDNDVCTMDSCGEPEGCANVRIPGCCIAGNECNDNDPCTIDACPVAGGMCLHSPSPACADAGVDAGTVDAGRPNDGGTAGGSGGTAGGSGGTAGGVASAGGSTAGGAAGGRAGGGSTGIPSPDRSGCGCNSAEGVMLLALVGLLTRRRRPQ